MGLPGWYEFMTSMAEIYFQTKVSKGCVSMWVHREMSRMPFFSRQESAKVCKLNSFSLSLVESQGVCVCF